MEWYYSRNNEQCGPVGSDELIALQEKGVISGNTLVWKEGQGDWREFREAADDIFRETKAKGEESEESGKGKVVGAMETAVCAHSGKVLPKNEMVPYGDAWVAPEHKDAFVQRLMEGEKIELDEAGEYALQYVGFWWRVLGSLIDYFVKLIQHRKDLLSPISWNTSTYY